MRVLFFSLLGCGVWITPEEQAGRLAELHGADSGGGDSGGDSGGGDSGGGDSGGGDSGDSGATDRVAVEVLDEFEFTGTQTHASVFHRADAGALSRLVYCGPLGGDNDGHAESVEALSEQDYDLRYAYDVDDPYNQATRGGTYVGGVPFLLPVSPDYAVPEGEIGYDFLINAAHVPFTCTAVTRYDSARSAGRLAVRLVFATASDGDADIESGPWPAALQYVEEAYAAVGITVEVRASMAPSGCVVSVVRDGADATDLAACVGDPGAREAVIVVVDEVRSAWIEPGETYGRTDAPGVPLLGVGPQSIALVARGATGLGERGLARVVSHQLGHFLGLFDLHAVAADVPDPIADDATCAWDGSLDVGDCTSGAADNAMWPFATESQAIGFTADQGWVMRRSAAVRP